MDKSEVRRLKALLMIADADLKACRAIVRLPEAVNEDRLRCYVKHLMENGTEILGLLDAQLTLDLDPTPENDPVINP